MGARVTVVEVDPIKALEAAMDGYAVSSMGKAAPTADFVVTATGNLHVVSLRHLEMLKDGAIICNAGHFNVEIDLHSLTQKSDEIRQVRENIQEFRMKSGKRVYLISEGRLVNLAAGEGHPAEVMDMSFANQALSVEWIAKEGKKLKNKVYSVPEHLDQEIARLKLISMGMEIEELTPEQEEYLKSWSQGT